MTHKFSLSILLAVVWECAAPGQSVFLRNNSILDTLQSITVSTIPSNGDLNPYGVAFVPTGFPSGGSIAPGDVLVSNFNNSSNVQGTGTTIVSISPTGQQTLFATSMLIGLDTALGVLSAGFVIVGNVPVTNGKPGQGSLQIFDKSGSLVTTLNDANNLDSPWDITIDDQGSSALVFVSNVLSGTITRLNLTINGSTVTVASSTQIGGGAGHAPNAAAVVVGPTGLAYDSAHDVLYVASTADNQVVAISNAGTRTDIAPSLTIILNDPQFLHGPLGLTLGRNGNLITANGDAVNAGGTPNDLVEFTQQGFLVATYQLDGGAPGAAFGVASTFAKGALRFAAVDDDLNTVTIWTLRSPF